MQAIQTADCTQIKCRSFPHSSKRTLLESFRGQNRTLIKQQTKQILITTQLKPIVYSQNTSDGEFTVALPGKNA